MEQLEGLPKAVFIGPDAIGKALSGLKPEWDWQECQPNVKSAVNAMREGTLDKATPFIFILDDLYKPGDMDGLFPTFVATMSSRAFVCLVEYRPERHSEIVQSVENMNYKIGDQEQPLFFFLSPKRVLISLDTAIENYLSNPNGNERIKSLLRGDGEIFTDESETQAAVEEELHKTASSSVLGRVVCVTSSKGGSGKSTITGLLASYLAYASKQSVAEGKEDRPLKIAIVDMDTKDGKLGALTGNVNPTVVRIFQEGVSQESCERCAIHSEGFQCDLYLAPKRPLTALTIPTAEYKELILQLRTMYDYVFLDTGVEITEPLQKQVCFPLANQIVFVTDSIDPSITSMGKAINLMTTPTVSNGYGIPAEKIGIVINSYMKNIGLKADFLKAAAQGVPILAFMPAAPRLIRYAVNSQSLEMVLKSNDLLPYIEQLGKVVVNDNYKLPEQFDSDQV